MLVKYHEINLTGNGRTPRNNLSQHQISGTILEVSLFRGDVLETVRTIVVNNSRVY
jgi:hypothetical protein